MLSDRCAVILQLRCAPEQRAIYCRTDDDDGGGNNSSTLCVPRLEHNYGQCADWHELTRLFDCVNHAHKYYTMLRAASCELRAADGWAASGTTRWVDRKHHTTEQDYAKLSGWPLTPFGRPSLRSRAPKNCCRHTLSSSLSHNLHAASARRACRENVACKLRALLYYRRRRRVAMWWPALRCVPCWFRAAAHRAAFALIIIMTAQRRVWRVFVCVLAPSFAASCFCTPALLQAESPGVNNVYKRYTPRTREHKHKERKTCARQGFNNRHRMCHAISAQELHSLEHVMLSHRI